MSAIGVVYGSMADFCEKQILIRKSFVVSLWQCSKYIGEWSKNISIE